MSGISKLWEDTYVWAKQYRQDLDIYLLTVLPSSYGILMNTEKNASGHGSNVVDWINVTEKWYPKESMEPIDKLESKNTSKIGIIPCAWKYAYVKFAYQCEHMINNKERLNGFKGSTKIQKRELLLKYQSHICNVKINSDVNHDNATEQQTVSIIKCY